MNLHIWIVLFALSYSDAFSWSSLQKMFQKNDHHHDVKAKDNTIITTLPKSPWQSVQKTVQAMVLATTIFSFNPDYPHIFSQDRFSFSKSVVAQEASPSPSLLSAENKEDEIYQLLEEGEKESILTDSRFLLPSINTPTDDFWYSPFLLGRWKTDLTFDYAEFHPSLLDTIPIDDLKRSLPGLSTDPSRQGSLFFLPNDVGKDRQLMLRFVQLDGHPRDDHPYNLRQFTSAFSESAQKIIVDHAPYSFQKAYNWVYSPANHWEIEYHTDPSLSTASSSSDTERGKVTLETLKRNINVETGFIETTEFFRQTLERHREDISRPEIVHTTYAVDWRLGSEGALRGDFISPTDLALVDEVYGKLNFVLFFEPTDNYYVKSGLGSRPAAVISYRVKMHQYLENAVGVSQEINSLTSTKRQQLVKEEMKRTLYPYVSRWGVGPVELNEFFGY